MRVQTLFMSAQVEESVAIGTVEAAHNLRFAGHLEVRLLVDAVKPVLRFAVRVRTATFKKGCRVPMKTTAMKNV